MISEGKIVKTFGTKAEVKFIRESACGGNCASCKGCSYNELTAVAENEIGGKAGDRVIVESGTKQILLSAFYLYICPLLAFFSAYVISGCFLSEDKSVIVGVVVFILFYFVLRIVDKKHNVQVRIVRIISDDNTNGKNE